MSELEPITREEQYLNAIAGGSNEVPEPITREEKFLKAILENGGGGGGGLPVVTQQDDGKVLKVTNGQWMAGSNAPLTEISYANLVELRRTEKLIPGAQYRITDYETIITGSYNLRALGAEGYIHYARSTEESWFDIIVTADDESHLNENARAARSDGVTYAPDAKPEAWELKYTVDNDTSRFAWADAQHGKGVIYWMKDEHNNSAGYDFKSIQFLRYALKLADATADYTPVDFMKAGYDGESRFERKGSPYQVGVALMTYMQSGNYENPFAITYKGNSANNYDFAVGYNILGTIQFPEADDTYLSTFNADWYYTFDYYDTATGTHYDTSSIEIEQAYAQHNIISACRDWIASRIDADTRILGLPSTVFEVDSQNGDDMRSASFNRLSDMCFYNTFGAQANNNNLQYGCYGNIFGSNSCWIEMRARCSDNEIAGYKLTFDSDCHDNFIIAYGAAFAEICVGNYIDARSSNLEKVSPVVKRITADYYVLLSNFSEIVSYNRAENEATIIRKSGYGQETAVSTTDGGATWA